MIKSSPTKTLQIILKGGLGNQMFQYASAKGIASMVKRDLCIDNFTAFFFDRKYHRNFMLHRFPVNAQYSSFYSRCISFYQLLFSSSWGRSICNTPFCNDFYSRSYFYPYTLITECSNTWSPLLVEYLSQVRGPISLNGYYQSYKFFHHISDEIYSTFLPQTPTSEAFVSHARLANSSSSLAVCLRYYEESRDPLMHSRDGKGINHNTVNRIISQVMNNSNITDVFIISSVHHSFFDNIFLPASIHYITPSMGYSDPVDLLWFISQFKNIIITNSSLYWWAAWLAHQHSLKKGYDINIYASTNFVNPYCVPAEWQLF